MNVSVTSNSNTDAITDMATSSLDSASAPPCPELTPSANEFMSYLRHAERRLVLAVLVCLFCVFTLLIFVEQTIFIIRRFTDVNRAKRTVLVLATIPIFSVCGTLGYMIPRSSLVMEFISVGFLGTSIYFVFCLMACYLGGSKYGDVIFNGKKVMSLRSPPCCCCCVCLPEPRLNRKTFMIIKVLVMQVAIVRPLLMVIALIAWLDGVYLPGWISPKSVSIYILVLNLISSITAIYGLLVTRNVLRNMLKFYRISGKIVVMKLILVTSVLPGVIINILEANGKITCTPIFSATDNSASIRQCTQVFIMLPIAFLANVFFRRESDGTTEKICLDEFQNGDLELETKKETGTERNASTEPLHDENKIPLMVVTTTP